MLPLTDSALGTADAAGVDPNEDFARRRRVNRDVAQIQAGSLAGLAERRRMR